MLEIQSKVRINFTGNKSDIIGKSLFTLCSEARNKQISCSSYQDIFLLFNILLYLNIQYALHSSYMFSWTLSYSTYNTFSAVNLLVSFLPAPSVAVLTGRVKLHLALVLIGRVPYARDTPTKSRFVVFCSSIN